MSGGSPRPSHLIKRPPKGKFILPLPPLVLQPNGDARTRPRSARACGKRAQNCLGAHGRA
eukprot:13793822-Alexandrium_andersonii.AAC.1